DRSQTRLYRGESAPWSTFAAELRETIEKDNDGLKAKRGTSLRFLTETITSPTLAAQMKSILTDFPEAKWHQYEPVNRDNARAGAIMAFGQDVNTIYDFSQADRVLSLGSDFLSAMPGTLRYARDYAAKRRSVAQAASLRPDEMTRLYVIESTPTITGANADHRFSVKPSQTVEASQAIASQLLSKGVQPLLGREGPFGNPNLEPIDTPRANLSMPKSITALAEDLIRHKAASIILAGDDQPP